MASADMMSSVRWKGRRWRRAMDRSRRNTGPLPMSLGSAVMMIMAAPSTTFPRRKRWESLGTILCTVSDRLLPRRTSGTLQIAMWSPGRARRCVSTM